VSIAPDELDELYADICDAVTRWMLDIPDDDGLTHTCDEARVVAARVVEVLGEYGLLLDIGEVRWGPTEGVRLGADITQS
jgi:hypothetical protein